MVAADLIKLAAAIIAGFVFKSWENCWCCLSLTVAYCSSSHIIDAMVRTTFKGSTPTAVSPESITASVPDLTATLTSVTSALVGRVLRVMLSSIWVAVITGVLLSQHIRIISCCIRGTFAAGNSTPISPRAIIITSATSIMSCMCSTASGFSILATTLTPLLLLAD